MKTLKINHRLILGLFVTLMLCLFIPQTVFCQTEKLGIVKYTPPSGWTKTPKENMIAFSDIKQTGKFCIITLYGATNGTGNPTGDFTREWNNLIVKHMKPDENPKPDTQSAEGWTILSGGSPVVTAETGKALAFLTVISGFGQTVSVLAVFNDPAYVKQVDDFISAIEMDKPAAPASTSSASVSPAVDENGKLIIPVPTRQLTVADLAGAWGEDDTYLSTAMYNSNTGDRVGNDRLAFRSKNTITKNGGYTNDFFAVRNGIALSDKTTGTVTINGSVLYINQGKSKSKYVIRGWLELPDATLLKITGPWYDGEIPPQVFTDLAIGVILDKIWVRKKK